MRVIRRKTFETNSSSTHSLSIIDSSRDSCNLPIEDNMYEGSWKGDCWEPDCLMVELTGFCGWDDHESQNDRLALICLLICYEVMEASPYCFDSYNDWNEYFYKVYESEQWKTMEQEISEYVNCRNVRVYQYSEGYIDHDSADYYACVQDFIDKWGLSSIVDYIFAKKIKTHFEFCG